MKKARGLSTICTSLALASPGLAQVPAPGCYARSYDAAHLAANPAQGVAELRLWVYDETPGNPAAIVAARMADQGQGAADGVAGLELRQTAFCDRAEGACFVECDGGSLATAPQPDGGLMLTTRHFTIGDSDMCGGTSNLSEGGETRYLLAAASPEVCADLSRLHPIPAAGCWGVDYPDQQRGQGVLALRLLVREGGEPRAFPLAEGVLAVKLPDSGRAAQGGMGGVRASAPVWCSAQDGLCLSSVDDGAFRAIPEGEALVLTTQGYSIWGPEGAVFDLAVDGAPTTHRLQALPMERCRGME